MCAVILQAAEELLSQILSLLVRQLPVTHLWFPLKREGERQEGRGVSCSLPQGLPHGAAQVRTLFNTQAGTCSLRIVSPQLWPLSTLTATWRTPELSSSLSFYVMWELVIQTTVGAGLRLGDGTLVQVHTSGQMLKTSHTNKNSLWIHSMKLSKTKKTQTKLTSCSGKTFKEQNVERLDSCRWVIGCFTADGL